MAFSKSFSRVAAHFMELFLMSLMQKLLKPADAAEFLGLSTSNLAKRRMTGEGPRFVKMNGAVRYDLEGLRAYVNQSIRRSTSDEVAKSEPESPQL
jgi:hypothetical protein